MERPHSEPDGARQQARETKSGLRIIHPELGYGRVELKPTTDHGYLYVAASVHPGPAPIVFPNRDRSETLKFVRAMARALESMPGVIRAPVFRAIVAPPTARMNAYLKSVASSIQIADFDVLVLVEATSIARAREIQASSEFGRLRALLTGHATKVHSVLARNAKLIADVDTSSRGLFLFNHFVAENPEVMFELWDYLAAWYVHETGVENSVALEPVDRGASDYALVNFARWDASLASHIWHQLSKRSFWRYVAANLEKNRAASMPIYCRRV